MAKFGAILSFCLSISLIATAQDDNEIRKSIFFGGGSYYIDEIQLGELSDWLDSIPNLLEKYEIEIISHTDPIGGKRFNEWLSKMRSEAVFDILIDKFIPKEIIHIKDWNYDNPIYANDSWEGRIMNRRVDVIVRPMVFWTEIQALTSNAQFTNLIPIPDTFFHHRTDNSKQFAYFLRLMAKSCWHYNWESGLDLPNHLKAKSWLN